MKNEIIKQNTSQFPAQSMAVIASNEATAIGNVYGNVNVMVALQLICLII